MRNLKIFSRILGCIGGLLMLFGAVCFESALDAGYIVVAIDIAAILGGAAMIGADLDLLDRIDDYETARKYHTWRRRR